MSFRMENVNKAIKCTNCKNIIDLKLASPDQSSSFKWKKAIFTPLLSAISLVILMYFGTLIAELLLSPDAVPEFSYSAILSENIGMSSLLVSTFVLVFGQSLLFITSTLNKQNKYIFYIDNMLTKTCELLLAYLLCMSVFILFSWSNVNLVYVIWSLLLVSISPVFSWVRSNNQNSMGDSIMYGVVSILFLIGVSSFTKIHTYFSCGNEFLCIWVN